jgi:hypothetical protein
MKTILAHSGDDDPDLLDGRTPRRGWVEIMIERLHVELLQQRLERRLQVCDLHVARVALLDQVDQHRDAGPIAVFDVLGVDEDAAVRCAGDRASRLRPYVADGRGIEPSAQCEHATTITGIGDGERCHHRISLENTRFIHHGV